MRDGASRVGAAPDQAVPDGRGDAAPLVFVEKQRSALRIVATNRAAQQLGLGPGLALADAQAQCPDLQAVPHDPDADRRLLERLADRCDRHSPMVAIDPPDALILDITGCAHLFGGESELVVDACRHAAALGVHVRPALADSPEAAAALARFAVSPDADDPPDTVRTRLLALPVAALRLDPAHETALRRAGLTTLGDLAVRPGGPLAARIGTDTLARLDRMLGRADSRIVPRRRPPPVHAARRFAEPLAHADGVRACLAGLAAAIAEQLGTRHVGARRFIARLYRGDGQVRDLIVETAAPLRDPDRLMRLVDERIESLADPLDPGFGFDLIRLGAMRLEPLAPQQTDLTGAPIEGEVLGALIDRLGTRLGPGRIRRFVPRATHIPEQAVLALPAQRCPAPAAWPQPPAGEPPLRPIHLFDPPQPVQVIAAVPDGPPHRFRWRRVLHEVRRYEGPERIAPEWWRDDAGAARTRDYYRVEDARGRRFWLFRHGLYGDGAGAGEPGGDPQWYLHGLFA